MSKQIILDALASQFAIKQNEFQQYTTTVYEPALVGLDQSIHDWFSKVLEINPHDVKYTNDTLEIIPVNKGNWPSSIKVRKCYSYGEKENNYYEIDYRSSHNKINDDNIYYLTTLGKIAQHINLIAENIENEWMPAYKAIHKPYYEMNSELSKLEREINAVKQEIHTAKREVYKVAGYEHTVSPRLACKLNHDTDQYELIEQEESFMLNTGRGKWDYSYVNTYRVIGPAKYNKIALEIKGRTQDNWKSVEVKYDYFDSFIESVYNWETDRKAKDDAYEIERYNKLVGKANQTV